MSRMAMYINEIIRINQRLLEGAMRRDNIIAYSEEQEHKKIDEYLHTILTEINEPSKETK